MKPSRSATVTSNLNFESSLQVSHARRAAGPGARPAGAAAFNLKLNFCQLESVWHGPRCRPSRVGLVRVTQAESALTRTESRVTEVTSPGRARSGPAPTVTLDIMPVTRVTSHAAARSDSARHRA